MQFFSRFQRGLRPALRRVFVAKINICPQRLWMIAALGAVSVLMGGCAAVVPLSSAVSALNPTTTPQIFNTTELRLQQKNFVMVKSNVIGQSKGWTLFGLITMVPARFNTAMTRLTTQADLKPGSSRTLADLTVEKDSNFYILFSVPRTTVRADVIEFIPDIQPQPPSVETKTNTVTSTKV